MQSDARKQSSALSLFALSAVAALAGTLDLVMGMLEINGFPLLSGAAVGLTLFAFLLKGLPLGGGVFVGLLLLGRIKAGAEVRILGIVGAVLLLLGAIAASVGDPLDGLLCVRRNLMLMALFVVMSVSWLATRIPSHARRAGLLLILPLLVSVVFSWTSGMPLVWPTPAPAVEPGPVLHPGRVLLIGVDGLCWETLERWGEESGSENLAWFRERGLVGPLKTYSPTQSPTIWTTIATGRSPEEHGVVAFTSWDAVFLGRSFGRIPRYSGAFAWVRAARSLGQLTLRPVSSMDVRCPPFWELLVGSDLRTHVIGWWCTWPALPFNGTLVSDKFFFFREAVRTGETGAPVKGVTYPEELETEYAPLRVAPEELSPADIQRFADLSDEQARAMIAAEYKAHDVTSELPMAFAMDETYYAVAEKTLEQGPEKGVFAFYFRGIDIVGHAAMYASDLYPESEASEEDRQKYGRLTSAYYEYTFARLRRLVELAGENALVIIVSDHGFEQLGPVLYGHDQAPDGVIMVPNAYKSAAFGDVQPSVYDLTPTMLWIAGYPSAKDMSGRELVELFPHLAMASQPRDRIDSYGNRGGRTPIRLGQTEEADEEMLELLRSLGYIE